MNTYEGMPASLPSLRAWRKFFAERGVDADTAELYLNYIRPLQKRGLPVIFEWEHLGQLLGRTPHYLAKVVASPENFYRIFRIPKKSGGYREICAPHRSLLECQKWIAINIINRIDLHPAATGYVQGKNLVDYVDPHISAKEIFVTDIKNFFPSIKMARIIGLFQSFGYSDSVSYALAKICCYMEALPQGGATSPSLSNLVCRRLDKRLTGYGIKHGIVYTRYADDLCFSGDNIINTNKNTIRKIISEEGFRINEDKTRKYSYESNLKIVAGINLAGGKKSLPKSFTRDLSATMYFIIKYGYKSHFSKKRIRDFNYIYKIFGKVAYWKFIEPSNLKAAAYYNYLKGLVRQIG